MLDGARELHVLSGGLVPDVVGNQPRSDLVPLVGQMRMVIHLFTFDAHPNDEGKRRSEMLEGERFDQSTPFKRPSRQIRQFRLDLFNSKNLCHTAPLYWAPALSNDRNGDRI